MSYTAVVPPLIVWKRVRYVTASSFRREAVVHSSVLPVVVSPQVVAMFPSETGLQIRGAFQKNFIVTSETVSTDVAKHIPVNAKIMMHQGLRRRFCMPGSGLKPQKVAMPSKEELASKAEETPAKKDKKKKDKKEKSAKKKKKDK